jgi:hypothetical protein
MTIMIELIAFNLILGQIKGLPAQQEIKVRIQTHQEDTYYLLTNDHPIEISVEGPTWIRVYTRIPWHAEWTGIQVYKIIQQENGQKEKFIIQESELSRVAKAGPIRLSKWRSFYINVPSGKNDYRFVNWASPSDSIFLKYASEAPKKWGDLAPSEYVAKLELTENEKVINYYETTDQKPVALDITGPQNIKITARLNYAPAMPDDQLFSIAVKEKGRTIKAKSFRAYRSETTGYQNLRETIPSNPHAFYFTVRKGNHRFEIYLTGLAGSAAVRIEAEQK